MCGIKFEKSVAKFIFERKTPNFMCLCVCVCVCGRGGGVAFCLIYIYIYILYLGTEEHCPIAYVMSIVYAMTKA